MWRGVEGPPLEVSSFAGGRTCLAPLPGGTLHLMLEMGPTHLKSQQQTLPMERTFSWVLGTRQSPRHFVNEHQKGHLCHEF